jgi:hypothetical protein
MDFYLGFLAWLSIILALADARRRLKELTEKIDRLEQGAARPGK